MCGRHALFCSLEEAQAEFSIQNTIVLTPRYNIAPATPMPIIRTAGQLEFLTWGFRPVWLKAEQNSFINARMETIQEKPSFRHAFKNRRCLILTNGYYEWKQIGNIKQPFFISLAGAKLFAFAGVWEQDTCAIITQPAQQAELLAVHARKPVVIEPQSYAAWLNPKTSLAALYTCTLPQAYHFIIAPVSTKVNNPRNDFIECTKALQ